MSNYAELLQTALLKDTRDFNRLVKSPQEYAGRRCLQTLPIEIAVDLSTLKEHLWAGEPLNFLQVWPMGIRPADEPLLECASIMVQAEEGQPKIDVEKILRQDIATSLDKVGLDERWLLWKVCIMQESILLHYWRAQDDCVIMMTLLRPEQLILQIRQSDDVLGAAPYHKLTLSVLPSAYGRIMKLLEWYNDDRPMTGTVIYLDCQELIMNDWLCNNDETQRRLGIPLNF